MRKLLHVLAIVAGVASVIGGPSAGLALGWVQRRNGGDALASISIALAVAITGVVLGTALAWGAWRAVSGHAEVAFALPGAGWLILAFLAALAAGQLAITHGPRAAMPAFQLAAGWLPSFIYLSLAVSAAHSKGTTAAPTSRRAVFASVAWGSLAASVLALLAEAVVLGALAILAVAWISATRPELMQQLVGAWQGIQAGRTPDPALYSQVLAAPGLAALALVGVGVCGPIIEEITKALAVPGAALAGRNLRRWDGFLLGVAAGAGFALVESTLNGALAVSDPAGWAGLMLARAATANIHCLASGLAGLGWQLGLSEGRWGRAVGLGALAVAIHGTWNTATAAVALNGVAGMGSGGSSLGAIVLPLLALGLLGALWLCCLVALPALSARLARGGLAAFGEAPVPKRDPSGAPGVGKGGG